MVPLRHFNWQMKSFIRRFWKKNCFRLPIELSSGARKRLELESFLKKSVISSETGPGLGLVQQLHWRLPIVWQRRWPNIISSANLGDPFQRNFFSEKIAAVWSGKKNNQKGVWCVCNSSRKCHGNFKTIGNQRFFTTYGFARLNGFWIVYFNFYLGSLRTKNK